MRCRSGQARSGALPHQGRPAGHRPGAQPLRPGAGLLRRRTPAHRTAADADPGRRARQRLRPSAGRLPMKPIALSALAGVLLILGVVPASQAVEILRWERLPLPVPLVVGQERVVFIDRNVRVGVPASVGDHLRVQSAGGAIYLRASEPIPPTRLQLQDVESGALILLDIAAEPAKDGQAPLEPVRIVEAEAPATRYGGGQDSGADEQADPPPNNTVPRPPPPDRK